MSRLIEVLDEIAPKPTMERLAPLMSSKQGDWKTPPKFFAMLSDVALRSGRVLTDVAPPEYQPEVWDALTTVAVSADGSIALARALSRASRSIPLALTRAGSLGTPIGFASFAVAPSLSIREPASRATQRRSRSCSLFSFHRARCRN